MSSAWPPLQPSTLADQVYLATRHRIVTGRFAPGEFIREQSVSEALGVSRTPVREALSRLASEGFLERIVRRGFRVPEQSLRAVFDTYPIVASLEVLAGTLAIPHLREEDLDTLRRTTAEMEEAALQGDAVRLVELDRRFHDVFCECSGNVRLPEVLGELRVQVFKLDAWYFSRPEYAQASISEHKAIIAAISEGDVARALSILEHNYQSAREALEEESEAIAATLEDRSGQDVKNA